MREIREKVKQEIQRANLIHARDAVVVGVSGGADSVCLLLLLAELAPELDYALYGIHVEHGIRGEESRMDANFVAELCARNAIPCEVVSVDVLAYAQQHGLGTEEAARILRYVQFRKAAEKIAKQSPGRVRVALAHHMEDNAETILFQMARGSGLKGMCGMEAQREEAGITYIRPLLGIHRREIEEYLGKRRQRYCTDATNADLCYSRNYIRHRVLPELCEVNDQTVEHMNRMAQQLTQVHDYMQEQAGREFEKLQRREGSDLCLSIQELLCLHPALRNEILRLALFEMTGQRKDIGFGHLEAIAALLGQQSGRRVDLSYGVSVQRNFGNLVFFLRKQENEEQSSVEEEEQLQEARMEIGRQSGEPWKITMPDGVKFEFRIFPFHGNTGKIPKKKYTKWFDYDMIKSGASIRKRKPGDVLCMDEEGHHKKLKQYFMEEKIPADRRNECWLFTQDRCVIWVVGGRIGENYKITHRTRWVLEVTADEMSNLPSFGFAEE